MTGLLTGRQITCRRRRTALCDPLGIVRALVDDHRDGHLAVEDVAPVVAQQPHVQPGHGDPVDVALVEVGHPVETRGWASPRSPEAWPEKHPRIHLHFTPTSGSWLNLVEI